MSPLAKPPQDAARAGLWWMARGDWDRAHVAAQSEEGADACWVHAYLHRVEGDLENARYWYGRAGRPEASGSVEDEWAAIDAALNGGEGGG